MLSIHNDKYFFHSPFHYIAKYNSFLFYLTLIEKLTVIETLLGGTYLFQITEAVHKIPPDVTLTPRAPGSPETFAGKHKQTLLNNDNKEVIMPNVNSLILL